VHNQCANLLLQRAIDKHENNKTLPVAYDFDGGKLVDLPPRGSIDFIYGGPPCQGFSGINRFKKADDIKNTLIATMVSYADFYRPDYFLLENVRGLLATRLGGKQEGNKVVGGVELGVVKFILRSLHALGYQTRICIQQAGNQNLAQSRRRFLVWGAKRGCNLPIFPQPTTCFPMTGSLVITMKLKGNQTIKYDPVKRSRGHAPLPAVTVWDALSDLPAFEYVNPHEKSKAVDPLESKVFANVGVVEKVDTRGLAKNMPIGRWEREYEAEPLSAFQRRMRTRSKKIVGHVTRPFGKETVERIASVAMFPKADHRSLPEPLKPWCLSSKDSAAARHNGWPGLFGRLSFNGHFSTALTAIEPMGKQGTVIHPSQRRVITLREHARQQGFPDHFIFRADMDNSVNMEKIKDMHRQVGNAVPPTLAYAIGMGLADAVLRNANEGVGWGEEV
ncbi:S-adenosyl-L-methionine-dependent methyltransferase, partial [Blyttiomyces helicus]